MGSVPEVLRHGVSGFIVRRIEEAVAALRRVPEISRGGCRRAFEERFTAERMTRDYLALYERLAGFAETGVRAAGDLCSPQASLTNSSTSWPPLR